MPYSRFVTHDQRYGVARFVDYENPLFEELEAALERALDRGPLEQADEPLRRALALRERMGRRYGQHRITPANRALLERRRPGASLNGAFADSIPCPSLSVVHGRFERDLDQAEPFDERRLQSAIQDAQTLREFERALPAALARAVALGAHESLLLYQSPGAKPLAQFEEALALGGRWRSQNDLDLLAAPALFCVAIEFYQGFEEREAVYLGHDCKPVIGLGKAAIFQSAQQAAEFAAPVMIALQNPAWAVARLDVFLGALSRPDQASSPSLPIFERALSLSQARQIEAVASASAPASTRARL